jgi:hypothetical protein
MKRFYAAFVRNDDKDIMYLLVRKNQNEKWEIPIGDFRGDSQLERLLGVQSGLGLSCCLEILFPNQDNNNKNKIQEETEVYILTHQDGELKLTEKYESHKWMTLAEFATAQDIINNYQKVRKIICMVESGLFQSSESGS